MAFMRWRSILVNWINCYDGGTDWQLNPEAPLVQILTKLKTSYQDHISDDTLADFIQNKYPQFKFENGTTTPSSEDDLFMAASLLLLFVCIQSKDVEVKNVMCKNLRRDDQEVILKFTKILMNKTHIKYGDVCSAIIDCCEERLASADASGTPPPLRALHGEVRRLRAALDAEKFDRTFLQDEVNKLNSKLEKLENDKMRFQKEISSLKGQLCERQFEPEHASGSPGGRGQRARRVLQRQLALVEERLGDAQGLLAESERLRQLYQDKLDSMKQQLEQCVSHASSESCRAAVLADQLDAERALNGALRERLEELQAVHALRRDQSVECDEELQGSCFVRDDSVGGEACTEVVEVQLLEERARITSLTQELKAYQDKISELEKVIMVRDKEIDMQRTTIKEQIIQKDEMQKKINENFFVIQRITNEVNQVKSDMDCLDAEYKKLVAANQTQVQELEDQIGKIISEARESDIELNNKINLLQGQNNDKEKQIKELNTDINLKVIQLDELNNEIHNYKENVDFLSQKIEEMKHQNNQLMEQVNEVSDIVVYKKKQMEGLQAEFTTLRNESEETLNRMDSNLNQLSAERNNLEAKVLEDNKNISLYQSQLKLLCFCLTYLNYNNKYLLQGNKEKERKLKQEINKINKLESDLLDKDAQLLSLHRKLEDFEVNLHEITVKKQKVQEENLILTQDAIKRESELRSLECIITDLQDIVMKKDEIIEEVRSCVKEVTSERDALKEECHSKCNIIQDIQLKTNEKEIQLMKEIDKSHILQSDLFDKNKQVITLQEMLENLKLNLKDIIFKSQTFQEKNLILTENIARCDSELKKSLSNANELHNIVIEKDEIIKHIRNSVEEITSERDMLREELQSKCNIIQDIQLATKEKEIQLNEKLLAKNSQVLSLQQKLECLEINNNTITVKNEAIQENNFILTENLARCNSELRNLENNIKQLHLIVKEKDNIISELRNCNKEVTNERNVLKEELQSKYNTIKELLHTTEDKDVQLKEERDKIIKLESDLVAKNEQVVAFQQKIDDFELYNNEIVHKVETVQTENLALTENISKRETELRNLESNHNELQNIVTEKDQLIKDIRNSVKEITSEKDTLREELQSKCKVIEEIKLATKEKEILLNGKLHAKDSQVLFLQQKLESLEINYEKTNVINETVQEKNLILTENVAKYESELRNLESNIKELHLIVKDKDNIISQVRNYNKEVTNERNVLKEESQSKCNTIKELLQTTKEKDVQLKEERDKIIKLESDLVAKTELVVAFQQKIHDFELNNNEIIHTVETVQKENMVLTENISKRETELRALESQYKELQNIVTEKDKIIEEIRNNHNDIISERNALQENLQSKSDIIKQLILQLNTFVDAFSAGDSNKINCIVVNIEKMCSSLMTNSEKLEINLKSLCDIYKVHKDTNDVLKTQCQEISLEKNAKINVLASEIDALSNSIANREDLVNNVEEERDALKEELQAKCNTIKELVLQLETVSCDQIGASDERNITISNLEKIVYDKNKTITTLQGDITYMKALVAESENKLLDITKELEETKETCQELSAQLKKVILQKNDEIGNLKKQLSKMSNQENSANQIIRVSAKYQAIILKRIAEIKSNSVLRELTQFSNVDTDKKLSLGSHAVTTDDLENFLEGTEKYLRKLSEKYNSLQRERDRLAEVSKINESETMSMKKYLTELLAHFKTFTSVKEVYNQKLSHVISKQRVIRREIHSLDETIPDSMMSKLERSYSIVLQDLCETALNFGRWSEKCIDRSISPEKLKQVFANDAPQLSPSLFQNTVLEIQLEELMAALKKVYEEVQKAKSYDGPRSETCSVMEVRTEYEEKLNRMKTKMKQLYQEQIALHQKRLESELDKMKCKMEEKSQAYEAHIQGLTRELWNVGEKLLVKKEESDWLRRRQSSTSSLMSLQHVHSAGLGPPPPRPRDSRDSRARERFSDAHSLNNFQIHKPKAAGNRGFHMSDEEGEVFDNRWLRELESPAARGPAGGAAGAPGAAAAGRVSELQYRNSLCPPHLKSSYPAETHAAPLPLAEDDIKFESGPERRGRKEVGITAYKKPGPPTPSKNAGRLSATDSELRESLRAEQDAPVRKTSTPSRLRQLFRSNRSDTENTPRSKRLSIFRKK